MYVYVYTIEINISNIHHKIFEAWKTFFSNSYLGVLRLFLRVLEVARSRRLGSVGEVSVWPDPATRETDSGGQFRATDFF